MAVTDRRLVGERIVHVLDRVIWWAGLGVIPLVAIPRGADMPWWTAAFEAWVFVLGSLWIVKGLFARAWPITGAKLLAPLLILGAYVILQTLPLKAGAGGVGATGRQRISADILGTYDFFLELLALIVLAKIWLDYTRRPTFLKWLIYVVIGVAVGSAAFGIIRTILQQMAPELVILGQAQGEGFGQFVNKNHFSLMLEMVLGLVLGFVLGGGVSRERLLLHIGLAVLLASTIVITSSRGGVFTLISLVLFVVTAFTIQRLYRSRSRLREGRRSSWNFLGRVVLSLVLIAGLVAVMSIGITYLGGEPLNDRMEKLPDELSSDVDSARARRLDVWRATVGLIRDHSIVGVGFGAYHSAIPAYHDASGRAVPAWAMSSYLDLVAGGGIVGVAIVAWCVVILLINIRRGLRSKDSLASAASLGGLGGLFGVAAHSLVDSGIVLPINAVILFALLVIASANPEAKEISRRLVRGRVKER